MLTVQKVFRLTALLGGLCLARGAAWADVGSLFVSSDFDAELARAADLLEAGQRPQAEAILSEVRARAAQRAWDARIDWLIALDDERRGDFAAAAARLAETSSAPIGLESYRRDRIARDLAAAGRVEEALREYRALEKSNEPYAGRTRTARDFAELLETSGSVTAAAGVLSRAAQASEAASGELAADRLRLALRTGDSAAIRALSRQVLFDTPLADRSSSLPANVRKTLRLQDAALSPADRARRGRALIAAGDARGGIARLSHGETGWPSEERGANLLALARGQAQLSRIGSALATAARVPREAGAPWLEARYLRARLELKRLRTRSGSLRPSDPRVAAVTRQLEELTAAGVPGTIRAGARERLIDIAFASDEFETGLEQARALVAESPGTRSGFEPLWKLAWARYLSRDCPCAREGFDALARLYPSIDLQRRLAYWTARCLEREGNGSGASALYRRLSVADPPDLYALFTRRRTVPAPAPRRDALPDPSEATATFRRVDELLRLRLFEEASAEARLLAPSRGRDLRLAESEFALGRFASAASAAKRAFPEMGTSEEARVPDGWRRLYYPIEEGGFLAERAREFDLDPAVLRGLVRQESLFEANAKSRAGALGLTQLLPSTARSVAPSVLRVRYRRAFLYDPGVNARLGAAYLRRLYDRFDEDLVFALAAYNGGPGRMAGVRRSHPGLEDDELFECHPASESRDYVRRVMLYAESYRRLYPG